MCATPLWGNLETKHDRTALCTLEMKVSAGDQAQSVAVVRSLGSAAAETCSLYNEEGKDDNVKNGRERRWRQGMEKKRRMRSMERSRRRSRETGGRRRGTCAQRNSTPEVQNDRETRIHHPGRSADAVDGRWGDVRRRITYLEPTNRSQMCCGYLEERASIVWAARDPHAGGGRATFARRTAARCYLQKTRHVGGPTLFLAQGAVDRGDRPARVPCEHWDLMVRSLDEEQNHVARSCEIVCEAGAKVSAASVCRPPIVAAATAVVRGLEGSTQTSRVARPERPHCLHRSACNGGLHRSWSRQATHDGACLSCCSEHCCQSVRAETGLRPSQNRSLCLLPASFGQTRRAAGGPTAYDRFYCYSSTVQMSHPENT